MISTRIISALILGLIFFLSFFNTNEIYFLAFSLILCFLALAELNNILFKNKSFLFLFISLLFLCLAFFQIPNPKLIAIMSLLFWFIYAPFFIFKNYKINFLHKYLLGIFLISNLFYSIFLNFHSESNSIKKLKILILQILYSLKSLFSLFCVSLSISKLAFSKVIIWLKNSLAFCF